MRGQGQAESSATGQYLNDCNVKGWAEQGRRALNSIFTSLLVTGAQILDPSSTAFQPHEQELI